MTVEDSTTRTPAPEGALVIVTGDFSAPYTLTGVKAIVEEYVPAADSEYGQAFYWLSHDGGLNNLTAPAEYVSLLKTPDQLAEDRTPSLGEVKRFLGSELLSSGEVFSIDETDPTESDKQLMLYGETHDGFRFGVQVNVEAIFETDF